MSSVIQILTLSVLTNLILTLSIDAAAYDNLDYGVNTHFAFNKGDKKLLLEWVKNKQITSIRDELKWGGIEYSKSNYSFQESNVFETNKVMKEIKTMGQNPMVILDYGNKFYDNGGQPYSSDGIEGYAKYARWVASETKDYVTYYEIWNEWNIGGGTKPKVRKGNVDDYVNLVKGSFKSIKSVNPKAKVIVGAHAEDFNGFPWLKSAISKGLLNYADGFSIHLYNYCSGNKASAFGLVERLRDLQILLRNSNHGIPIPIYVTEVGWPTHSGQCGVSEEVAAEQTLRFLVESRMIDDLAGVWWDELKDSGNNQHEREHRFGLVRSNNMDKPSGCRFKNIVPILKDVILENSIIKDKVTVMLFKHISGRKLLSISAGDNLENINQEISIIGHFENIIPYEIKCGDRTDQSEQFSYNNNTMTLSAHSYSRLFWVDSNSNLMSIR